MDPFTGTLTTLKPQQLSTPGPAAVQELEVRLAAVQVQGLGRWQFTILRWGFLIIAIV